MATRLDNVTIDSGTAGLLTALGGTVTASDSVWVGANQDYSFSGGQNLGQDLTLFALQASHRKTLLGGKFNATAGDVYLGGAGTQYSFSSLGSKAVWLRTIVELAGPGVCALSDLTLTTLRLRRGVLTMGADCDVTTAYLSGGQAHLAAGGAAATTVVASADASLVLERDCGTLDLRGRAVARLNSTTCTLTTLLMTGGDARAELLNAGNITTVGAAAGGAEGTLDLSRQQVPVTIGTIYHSRRLTVILPQHNPSLVTFSSVDQSNGAATVVYA